MLRTLPLMVFHHVPTPAAPFVDPATGVASSSPPAHGQNQNQSLGHGKSAAAGTSPSSPSASSSSAALVSQPRRYDSAPFQSAVHIASARGHTDLVRALAYFQPHVALQTDAQVRGGQCEFWSGGMN
jgi:hypothetical protein